MQRTGIYVFQPSTVTIHDPAAAMGSKTALMAYRDQGNLQPVAGSVQLEPGIYQVVSQSNVLVTGDNIQVVATPNGKDDWPKPPVTAFSLEHGADEVSILAFFSAAKDASPND